MVVKLLLHWYPRLKTGCRSGSKVHAKDKDFLRRNRILKKGKDKMRLSSEFEYKIVECIMTWNECRRKGDILARMEDDCLRVKLFWRGKTKKMKG